MHEKAEWPVDFAWLSSPALVWNEALQTIQVFAVGHSRLVCSKKLEDRDSVIRGVSVDDFLGTGVVSKVDGAQAKNQSRCAEGRLKEALKEGKIRVEYSMS